VKVAKHGNRAASSRCGSADLLERLGVVINLAPECVARCIEEVGIGFMFAPAYHPAMKNVAQVRRELGVRTIFNILGPLANPAGVTRQFVGVFDRGLLEKYALTLQVLGAETAVIVHGEGGYDEATTTGSNELAVLRSGGISSRTIEPEELGFDRIAAEELTGGSPEENASISLRILDGEPGPRSDVVILNSGLGLYAARKAGDVPEGVELARESISSGKAREVLENLISLSQALSE
jgi:anthranilate phosphoribosyltransferase